ncbi:MAG: sulfur oxidation c-type cytochrome SoxX [Acidiphilium sp.]|nr:sulfur oxidation c-type cytochrome SoxX [Acidiphilium sp.]MDD4934636.1 sulfur oxidation c-type cytochrome SoxX [Acidiphilium sp.]
MKTIITVVALGLLSSVAAAGVAAAATPAEIAAGEKLATTTDQGNCDACHMFKGADEAGNIGPELKDVKSMVPNRKEFYAIIYDEEARNPQTIMPAFGKNQVLTPKQINEVIDFMYTK